MTMSCHLHRGQRMLMYGDENKKTHKIKESMLWNYRLLFINGLASVPVTGPCVTT
jgi:hypothetical protein